MAQFRDYLIAVKTGDMPNAGMDGSKVYVTLGGTFGISSRYNLNQSSEILISATNYGGKVLIPATGTNHDNKWIQNKWDVFKIRTNDVGSVLDIRVEKDGTDAWLLEQIVVIPYKYNSTNNELDLDNHKIFSCRRWFDSADYDSNNDLSFSADQPPGPAIWNSAPKPIKTFAPIVLRYDNTGLDWPEDVAKDVRVETTFIIHYTVVQGVAIEDSTAKDEKSGMSHSWGVEVSAKSEAGGLLAKASVEAKVSASGTYSTEVSKSCSSKFGATTTTTIDQTQSIPIRVKKDSAVTLIVIIYQNATHHEVEYGGFKVPVTVFPGTADLTFKLYSGILTDTEVQEKIKALNIIAGISAP